MFAGTAKVDITPDRNVRMDGMIREHESTGVLDPIYARVLYLCPDLDRTNSIVVVSVDVCALNNADARAIRRIAELWTGVPAKQIIIASTHTHSGPTTLGFFCPVEADYLQSISHKICDAIAEAVLGARPAAVGTGTGTEETISHYRRLLHKDGHVVMNWEPYSEQDIVRVPGEPDPQVGVLKIVDAADPSDLICLLFNHAGHPNMLSGDNYLISPDYPGRAASLLEETLGGIAMFANGAQGSVDIDPLKDRDMEGVERAGRALADAVAAIAADIKPSKSLEMRHSHVRYSLEPRHVSRAELAWADDILARTNGVVQAVADGVGDDYKAQLYKKLAKLESSRPVVEQTCFTLGDTAFLSFPGELFTEIGMRIKAASPFSKTHILGLSNGYVGYIPTRDAIAQGGYEVDTRLADASAEDKIVERSIALLNNMKQA